MSETPATTKHDWSRIDAMSEAERHAAALSDPDAQQLTPKDFARMKRTLKRTPQVKIIRRALALSQEEFAAKKSRRIIPTALSAASLFDVDRATTPPLHRSAVSWFD